MHLFLLGILKMHVSQVKIHIYNLPKPSLMMRDDDAAVIITIPNKSPMKQLVVIMII